MMTARGDCFGSSVERHPANPLLPPVADSEYDCGCCMNPHAVLVDDMVHLYYAGADARGHRRICLATASVDDVTTWQRHGPLFDLGPPGAFDHNWCVLPCLHRFGDRWHLYYSGHEGSKGLGLQGFPGIGLAVSDDGIHFEKVVGSGPEQQVITGDQVPEFPTNRGIAGGGTILEDLQPDGSVHYRMYYTLATGTPSPDQKIDQEKHCAVCFSTDGITWTDHRLVLSPRPEVARENAAVAAPWVWREESGLYRMIYSPIGDRYVNYSMAQAVSEDGLSWHRGEGDENIVLAPDRDNPESWEHEMVEYPSVLHLADRSLLFYCGNGYGATGIGVATIRGRSSGQ